MNFLPIIHTLLVKQLLNNHEKCKYYMAFSPFFPNVEIACKNWTKSELMDMNSLELISILKYYPGGDNLEYILLFLLIGIPMIILWMYWKFIERCKILHEESVRQNANIFITLLSGKHHCVLWAMIPFVFVPIWIIYLYLIS
jgi:hypothetical protein